MIKDVRGQAAIEMILLTFVLVTFVAAAYQIFLVNRTVFRSLTAVHQVLFSRAFDRNCSDRRSDQSCVYSQDPSADGYGGIAANVVWSPAEIPEVMIPVIGLFRGYGLSDDADLRLSSNRLDFAGGDGVCSGAPCKRTRIGAGTYESVLGGIWLLRKTTVDPNSLIRYVEWGPLNNIISVLQ
jgi:hypothetical protein